ncbi:MAG: Ig-like domain-containing protein [Chania sp.]
MKNITDSSIRFSVITEGALIQTSYLDTALSAPTQYIPYIPGNIYVVQEVEAESIAEVLVAERSGEDLIVTLQNQGTSQPHLVIENFFTHHGQLHQITQDGEFILSLSAQDNPQQGPATFGSQALGHIEQQPQQMVLSMLHEVSATEANDALPQGVEAAPAMAMMTAAAVTQDEAPVITHALDQLGARKGALKSGNVTDDQWSVLEGSGTPGATLEILDNGRVIGEVRVSDEGFWSFEPEEKYSESGHVLVARDKTSGQSSETFALIVDSVAPSRAVIDSISSDSALIAKDGYTNDNTPVIKGHAEAFSVVGIYSGKNMIGTALADENGAWEFSSFFSFPDDKYTLSARAIDFAGNTGLGSLAYTITIDTIPPALPTILEASDNVGSQQAPLVSGDFTDDSTPTLSGKAEAGVTVFIYDNGDLLGTTKADGKGDWSFTPTILAKGEHNFTTSARDQAGNTSNGESDTFTLTLDFSAPDVSLVAITGVDDAVGALKGNVVEGGMTDDNQPTLRGTGAEVGNIITVYNGTTAIGTATVQEGGTWSLQLLQPLEEGLVTLTAKETDRAGNTTAPSAEYSFTIGYSAPSQQIAISGISDDTGVSTADFVTNDTTLTIRGTLDAPLSAGQVVQISLDGGTTWSAVTMVENNTWNYVDSRVLSDGTYTYMARVLSPFGVAGSTTQQVVTVDTLAPVGKLVLDLVTTSDNGVSTSDNITGITNPTIQGAVTEIGEQVLADIQSGKVTVMLFNDVDNDGVYGEGDTLLGKDIPVTINGTTGSFTYTLPTLKNGTYNLKAVLMDTAGNQSNAGLLDDNASARLVVDNTVSTQGIGTQANDGLGYALTSIGDFNGDGIEDFMVSAPHLLAGSITSSQSSMYIVYGTPQGLPQLSSMDALTPEQGIRMNNPKLNLGDYSNQGMVVTKIGDLNGDGYDDVIVSSDLADSTFVLFGGENGMGTIDLDAIKANSSRSGFMINGSAGSWSGVAASGGDYNGDGYADIVFGGSDANKVYVLYGHAGDAGTAAWSNLTMTAKGLTNKETKAELSADEFTYITSSNGAVSLGDRHQSVGDVNGDGYEDFIISYPRVTLDGNTEGGAAYLMFGTAKGYGNTLDLFKNYASVGVRFTATEDYEELGDVALNWGGASHGGIPYGTSNTIASLGDINGDGINDFIIGSPLWGDKGNDGLAPGRAYVMYGKSGAWSDLSLKNLDGSNGFYLTSSNSGTNALLGQAVRSAGDVNGDGIDDFLIGAPDADSNGKTDNGAVYMVYGQAGGGFAVNTDLDALVAAGQAKKWVGDNTNDYMGTNIGSGDWNGDGIQDIAIPSWGSDQGATNGGKYDVYYGSVENLTQAFTVGDDVLVGLSGLVDRISGGLGNDRISNIGTGDVAYGGGGNDTISIVGTDFVRVDGGLGIDTLKLDGQNMHLNLAEMGQKVQGFEHFDLSNGNNFMNLRLSDLIQSGERNLLIDDGKMQMQITGDNGQVELNSGATASESWVHQGATTLDGVAYNVYSNVGNTGELFIENTIGVTIY